MENMTFHAHFDGTQILLDEPVTLAADTKLLVTVLEPKPASSPQSTLQLLARLNEIYSDGLTEEEQKHLRQMTASQRRLVEGEW